MWTSLATLVEMTVSALAFAPSPAPFERGFEDGLAALTFPPEWAALRPLSQTILDGEEAVRIIDETQPVASVESVTRAGEVALGALTDLGPGSLNLEAMAALDAAIDQLVALEGDLGGDLAGEVALPAPFACNLVAESDALTARLLTVSDAVSQAWNLALDADGINAMAQETVAEQCAFVRAMQEALTRSVDAVAGACSPVGLALKLADTASRVTANAQPKWARELSLLAQRQREHTYLGKDPADLCPEYRALEAAMQADIRG